MADDKQQAPAKDSAKVKGKRGDVNVGAAGKVASLPAGYSPRMKKLYEDVVRPALVKEFGYKNALEVPRIEKIVLNMGVGDAVNDTKKVTAAASELALDCRSEADCYARPQGHFVLQAA